MMLSSTTSAKSQISEVHSQNYRIKKFGQRVGKYAVLVLFALFFAFPLVFMVVTSFKTDSLQVTRDLTSLNGFVPYGQLGFDNYVQVFQRIDFLRYLFNTFLIIGVGLTLGLLFNSMLAFALARLNWRGRYLILTLIVLLIIIPPVALTVPLLQLVNFLGWFDSYQVIIVPTLITPLHIFLFYQFFIGIPKDFDEAAIVDGASYGQIYWRIIVPLSRPVFATVTILAFLAGWSTYLWPLLTTHSPDYWPIMVGLGYFRDQQPAIPGQIMAFVSMVTVPVLIVFGVFQRYFIASVASSGVKG